MSIEVEQKFSIGNPDEVLAGLSAIGAESLYIVRQVDTYYSHPQRDFAATDEALRIRRVGESNFVTYKGPKLDTTTKTRREIELPLASGAASADDFGELLDALSFQRVAEVKKIRQSFRLQRDNQTIEVSLDQVQDVGGFVEIEIVVDTDAQIEPARQLLAALATELNLAGPERRSYLEMLLDTPSQAK